jgi:undecaprenyl-diphosphatase
MGKKDLTKLTSLPYILIAEIVIGLLVSTAALLVFIKLAINISELQKLDDLVSNFVYSVRSPLLTEIMFFLSYLGQELLYVFLGILLLLLLKFRKWNEVIILITVAISGGIINIIIKEVISRDRPTTDPLFQELFHSFPSFHAMNSFIFYSFCVFLIYKFTRNRMYTFSSFFIGSLIVLGVGSSRIYLGVHYFSDVIAGYVIGLGWVTAVVVIEKFVSIFRRK